MSGHTLRLEQTLSTLGGRITCQRCQAKSKRTKLQCAAPATRGKSKCRFHGGASTGPKTPEGRGRCADAKKVHGRETTAMRQERSLASARLAVLESVGFELGILVGTRTRGRKPEKIDQVLPELRAMVRRLRFIKMNPLEQNTV